MSKTFLYLFLTASAFSAVPVCAQSQNAEIDASLSSAAQALATAEAVQAGTLAPDEYRNAELALQVADAMLAKRKGKEAKRLAGLARLYADLAAAKARYLQSRENVEQKTSENQALRRELLLGAGGRPL